MLSLFDKSRCKRCRNERIVRKCPRFNKDICWGCCNETRYNLSCPESCDYAGKLDEKSPFPSFKADSYTEARLVTSLYIDLWVDKVHLALDGKSPKEAAAGDKDLLMKWLSSFQYPAFFPLDYLMEKLSLSVTDADKAIEAEDLGDQYLNSLIALDWSQASSISINTSPPQGCSERYQELLSDVNQLRKISTYRVIHGGVTEDANTALVYYELNHSKDLTLVFSRRDKQWRLRQNILGSPKDFFMQNSHNQKIAEALSKADDSTAFSAIEEAFKIYPDSADLYYYRGIYWQMVKELGKAKVDFFNSISLDNGFQPSYFHLAILNAQENKMDEAIYWFEQLDAIQPGEAETRSNLAACYAAKGDKGTARKIWQELRSTHPDFEAAKLNLEKLDGKI